MVDYVGDTTQFPKWHVNPCRSGGDPYEGVKLMVCALFVCFFSYATGQTAGPICQNACFCESCIPSELEQLCLNFRVQNPPKTAQNKPD